MYQVYFLKMIYNPLISTNKVQVQVHPQDSSYGKHL